MQNIKIPIKPGSMLSDVVETDLSFAQHERVVNLRQVKLGEWETVKGYVDYMENNVYGVANFLNAIEVTLDETGERFLLFQLGVTLQRVDYDSGYDIADAYNFNLPSGVSVIATSKLRFFEFRGVVRITGAVLTADNSVQVPLWYGYIPARTLFPDAWEEITLDDFESDTDGWQSSPGSTCAQYEVSVDADGAGMSFAPGGEYVLKIGNAAPGDYGYNSYTCESGKTIRFYAKVFRASSGAGNIEIKLGSTLLGSEYADLTTTTEDEWVTLEATFTSTGTTLYVQIFAGSGVDTAYFDFIYIEELSPVVMTAGWYLEKAGFGDLGIFESDTYDSLRSIASPDNMVCFAKASGVYDKSQFSLSEELTINHDPILTGGLERMTDISYEIASLISKNLVQFIFRLEGANLESSFVNKRLTGILFLLSVNVGLYENYTEDDLTYSVIRNFDITESLGDYGFATIKFDQFSNDKKNRLYLCSSGEYNTFNDIQYFVGQRITLKNVNAELDTIITAVNFSAASPEDSYIDVADDCDSLVTIPGIRTALPDTTVILDRKWIYSETTGYKIYLPVEVDGTFDNFNDFTEIGNSTEDINPAYSHHQIIEERAYCVSLEDEEEDVIRYSPLYQYDVFPNGNVIQTQVGDADQIKAIIARGDRLMILKRKSISQAQFIGGSYYEDVGFALNGLYATYGYIVIDNILYWMDKDDIYSFAGNVQPMPLMKHLRLRRLYRQYVNIGSFIAYDKQNDELWFVLNGIIFVYQIEFGSWYIRDTDISPTYSFVDYSKNLIMGNAAKMVNYNHSDSSWNEDIGFSVDTRIVDLKDPYKTKRMGDFIIPVQSSDDLVVTVTDPNKTQSKNTTKSPNEAEIIALKYRMKYLFKQLQINIANETDADDLVTKIREMELNVQAW